MPRGSLLPCQPQYLNISYKKGWQQQYTRLKAKLLTSCITLLYNEAANLLSNTIVYWSCQPHVYYCCILKPPTSTIQGILLTRLSATAKTYNMGDVSRLDSMLCYQWYFEYFKIFFEYFAKILWIDLLSSFAIRFLNIRG